MSDVTEKAVVNNGAVQEVESVSKAEETKAEKFVRIGEYRINKAIAAIGRIENLANKSAYDYTPEQVKTMFFVLESRVAEVKAKFTTVKSKENTAFSFGNRTE